MCKFCNRNYQIRTLKTRSDTKKVNRDNKIKGLRYWHMNCSIKRQPSHPKKWGRIGGLLSYKCNILKEEGL
jgi:hypothetical protein